MKIGISALTFIPGGSGGVETYFRNLIDELQKNDKSNTYCILMNSQNIDSINLTSKNFRKLLIEETGRAKFTRKLRLAKRDANDSIIRQIEKNNFDLIHFPFQIIQPMGINVKKVLTFHDMQQEFWPIFFSAQELEARRRTFKPSALASNHIVAISNFTKNTLVERYKISSDKISVIYESYDEQLYGKSKKMDVPDLQKPYFYYPAATWPHKNHLRLLEAFAKLHAKRSEYNLVFSGVKMQATEEILKKIKELDLENEVTILGYLDYEQLPAIYQNAFALVFPSLFEGFGIPLLEAMASKCPIIASNTTSIPEVAGSAALYFDPLDVDAIATEMEKLINDQRLRLELIKEGEKQIKKFSQKKMAQETLNVYKKVASS